MHSSAISEAHELNSSTFTPLQVDTHNAEEEDIKAKVKGMIDCADYKRYVGIYINVWLHYSLNQNPIVNPIASRIRNRAHVLPNQKLITKTGVTIRHATLLALVSNDAKISPVPAKTDPK